MPDHSLIAEIRMIASGSELSQNMRWDSSMAALQHVVDKVDS